MPAIDRLSPGLWRKICEAALEHSITEPSPYRYHTAFGKGTVAALSATCKSIHEPALDALWNTIPDIAALFSTLPDETYEKEVIVLVAERALWSHACQEEIIFTFVHDEVDYAVLARFLDRARRVRAIVSHSKYYQTHSPRRTLVAAPSVYAALTRTLTSRPLLPSLHILDYTRGARMDFNIFDVLDVLISPNLKHFGVENHGHMMWRSISPPDDSSSFVLQGKLQGEAQFCNMLGKLRDRAQSLRTFQVVVEPSSSSIMSAITDTLCDFRQLVVLSVNAWSCEPIEFATPAFFAYCAQLPYLRELYILLDDPPSPHDWRQQVSSQLPPNWTSFPCLRQFHPNVKNLALITELLPLIHSTALETLSICSSGDIRSDQIHPFFAGIASLPAREHLQSLSLSALRGDVVSAAVTSGCTKHPVPLGVDAFKPLLTLPQIRKLVVELQCPYDIDDAFLEKMAMRWPDLHSLNFAGRSQWDPTPMNQCSCTSNDRHQGREEENLAGPGPAWQIRPRATLLGLLHFAAHCPDLRNLHLEIDANLAIVRPSIVRESIANGPRHALSGILSVGYSPIENPHAVAAFLSGIFSSVGNIISEWPAYTGSWPGERAEDEEDEVVAGQRWWQRPCTYHRHWGSRARVHRCLRESTHGREAVGLAVGRYHWPGTSPRTDCFTLALLASASVCIGSKRVATS